jgi:hypothetical protein
MLGWLSNNFWFSGIVFPIVLVLTSLITTLVLTNRSIRVERELGVKCVDKDIKAASEATQKDIEATIKVIQANGEQTLKAIVQDGKQTRESILTLQRGK